MKFCQENVCVLVRIMHDLSGGVCTKWSFPFFTSTISGGSCYLIAQCKTEFWESRSSNKLTLERSCHSAELAIMASEGKSGHRKIST